MRANDPLLEPYQLKHLTLKNRIMTTAHEPAYTEDGMPKQRYRAYHEERVKAGIAMIMTAGSAIVSQDSPPAFGNILAYQDEVVGWMKQIADMCHDHDAAIMIQLTHLGRRTAWSTDDWLPVVSASHQREIAHKAFPKRIEGWDIERIIRDYADAAERMQQAGLDGIELEAYGHLIDQIWSPLTNTLDAPYGGSFDNRMKFIADLLDAIRARVGKEFIVGVRYSADELSAQGISVEEGLQISHWLKDSGQVDFLNVIRGRVDSDAALADVIPVMGMPNAPHLDFAGSIRAETGMPTFHAARIADVATARHAISAGKLDMVGMTRAHMADPHIVEKIRAGREDDIRPCVGATYCLDRIYQGGEALCIHNAATGRELSMPHRISNADKSVKVVIVGAGPAGLEAARVAAERGHEVVVFEALPQPGGQIRLTALNPRRRDMMAIIDWRMAQCDALGVSFHFNSLADADDIKAENPQVVIIATGGLPHTEILDNGNDLVVSTWDIISRDVKPANRVLLFDDAGDHSGLQAAEVIAESGAELEIVTPDRSFASEIMGLNLVPYLRALQPKQVIFTVTYRLLELKREGNALEAQLGSDYGDFRQTRSIDQVVVNHGLIPLDDVYFELKPDSSNLGEVDYTDLTRGIAQRGGKNPNGTFQLFRIGDAVSTRNTHAAIYDALRLLKDL